MPKKGQPRKRGDLHLYLNDERYEAIDAIRRSREERVERTDVEGNKYVELVSPKPHDIIYELIDATIPQPTQE